MTHWTVKQIPNQTGKTALVTGANSGIGFYTALELARAGATTILACRNLEKAEIAIDRIKAEVPNARIEIVRIDLSDLNSVAQCADEFLSRNQQLNLLINNAGVVAARQRMTTKDGFELQWGTNHLGTFALTGRLLPAILSASQGRIVTVSSLTHRGAKIDFDDLNREKSFDRDIAYGQSKLANAVFGIELQKRLSDRKQSAISLVSHPGISRTDLTSNIHGLNPTFQSWFDKTITPLFGQPASQGALPTLYAATSPAALGGKLYGPHAMNGWRGYPVEETFDKSATADPNLAGRLWTISEEQSKVKFLS